MDVSLLEKLVKLMAANDLNTIELREGNQRVTLKRGAAGVTYAPPPAGPSAAAPSSPVPETPPLAGDEAELLKITSPMPGTFYRAAKPGEKPFVKVGSEVDERTDVCIIEAMKMFNPHQAGVRGTIQKVCAEDGKPVEFGTVLFLVKPK